VLDGPEVVIADGGCFLPVASEAAADVEVAAPLANEQQCSGCEKHQQIAHVVLLSKMKAREARPAFSLSP
jgi:hypothetical protein